MAEILENCEGFEWDEGNTNKNWHRHRVTDAESQEVFSNLPILVLRDPVHSRDETRFAVRGITNSKRRLTVIFTVRDGLIRVISARDMTPREQRGYEEKTKRDTKI
jgi:uncharacterized DUF497 family protein